MSEGKFYMVPNVLMHLHLCPGEIAVYNYLLYCENRKTFQCYPSYRTIGKAIGMSRNSVKKYVRQLEEKQLIRTEPTDVIWRGGRKYNGNLLYTILPIQMAVNHFHQEQLIRLRLMKERLRIQDQLDQQDG